MDDDRGSLCARPLGVFALSVCRISAVSNVFSCPAPSSRYVYIVLPLGSIIKYYLLYTCIFFLF